VIPDEVVEQVRDSADIVQIVGEYVNLKRQGTDFRGPCPFHQGTHRNFSVSPKKRMYYCFVCHEGGDVFHFLQKRLGVEWPAAVKMVGEKSGIEVREVDTRREGPDPREPLWEVNATAAGYYQKILWDDPLGAQARDYRSALRPVTTSPSATYRAKSLISSTLDSLHARSACFATTWARLASTRHVWPRPGFSCRAKMEASRAHAFAGGSCSRFSTRWAAPSASAGGSSDRESPSI